MGLSSGNFGRDQRSLRRKRGIATTRGAPGISPTEDRLRDILRDLSTSELERESPHAQMWRLRHHIEIERRTAVC